MVRGRYRCHVRISPTLASMATYPFVHLEEARRRLVAEGREVVDFGKGDPQEPTDARIRRALVENLGERSGYPLYVATLDRMADAVVAIGLPQE